MKPTKHDPAATAEAFEHANAILALEGFEPDAEDKELQRWVISGELTSDQAVQLIVAEAQAKG